MNSSLSGSTVAFDPRQTLLGTFILLRRRGLTLGIGELLAAYQVVESGWSTNTPEALLSAIRLLWCNSFEEEHELEMAWAAVAPVAEAARVPVEPRPALPPSSERPSEQPEAKSPMPPPKSEPASGMQEPMPHWETLPVQAPFRPTLLEDAPELHTYWPVSRRFMVYAWRYLRRPLADGAADVLDVTATVELAARQGFFLRPVYRRREINHAHLVLLLDQGGSMIPFHRFTRDMVETAQHESTIEQVDAFYFHDVPADDVYLDRHMTLRVPYDQMLAGCSPDTSLLIVSDAGAARGHRQLDRIKASTEFLSRLKEHTLLIAWLNPMPQSRWPSTSAQIIAHLVPMYQMDPDGLSKAIDVVRGQSLQPYGWSDRGY